MDIIYLWNLARYIEDLISYWFFMSCRPCVSFVASITLGAWSWGGFAVLQLFLRKHLMVCSECQNTINCSLNHYTVKCCGTLICGKQQLGQLCRYRNFFSPRDMCSLYESWARSLTKYGHVLYSGTMLSHLHCSMPSRHYISIIMQLKKCYNYGPGL